MLFLFFNSQIARQQMMSDVVISTLEETTTADKNGCKETVDIFVGVASLRETLNITT